MIEYRPWAKKRYLYSGTKTAAELLFFLSLICMGCAGQEEDAVVAQVGEKKITLQELQEYSSQMPEYLQSKKTGLEKARNHLQTMIDTEILLLEVAEQGIENSSRFLSNMREAQIVKLAGIFEQREIDVNVRHEEIQELFEKGGFSRAIRFSDIVVDTKSKAKAAYEEIKAGKSFVEVAEKWSRKKELPPVDHPDQYTLKSDLKPVIRDRIFALEVGEVLEPMQLGDRYLIFKAVADTIVSLSEELYRQLYKEVYTKKHSLQRMALLEKLKNEYRVQLDEEGLDACFTALRQGAPFVSQEERNIVVYRYDGGEITAGDLVDTIHRMETEPPLEDRGALVAFAESAVIPDIVFMEAAMRAGIDKEEDVARWFEKKRRLFLVGELRERMMEGKLEVSDEEARQHYGENPDMYMRPEQVAGQEILVATEEEGLDLLERIRQGASMGELAKVHSLRHLSQRDEEGRFTILAFEGTKYSGLLEAAQEAPIGELTGPVAVEGGYSIFRVDSRKHEREPFSTAQKRVKATIKWMRKQKIFEEYMEELRQKYASQVSLREDRLREAFGTG